MTEKPAWLGPAPVAPLGGPVAMVRRLARRWDLVRDFTRRELVGRYRGSILGVLWSFVHPVFMLVIYTFVFGVIFRIRPGAPLTEFAIWLFTGMIVFNLMSEVVANAPSFVLNRPTFVKKVVFPLEILPFVMVLVSVLHFLFAFGALLLAKLLFDGRIEPATLLFPIFLLPLCFFSLGLAYVLASLGVFLRDVRETVGVLMLAWFFLTPIFWDIGMIQDDTLRTMIFLNPVTLFVTDFRQLFLDGTIPTIGPLLIAYAVHGLLLWLGYLFFMRTRHAFADVL